MIETSLFAEVVKRHSRRPAKRDVPGETLRDAESAHRRAMEFVDHALAAKQKGDAGARLALLNEAQGWESKAAALLSECDFEPTRSVLHRSAASLALECGKIDEAVRLVRRALQGDPAPELVHELEAILSSVPGHIVYAVLEE